MPNITGKAPFRTLNSSTNAVDLITGISPAYSSGALVRTAPVNYPDSHASIVSTTSGVSGYQYLNITASNSSNIYGSSNTVTPKSITIKVFIKY